MYERIYSDKELIERIILANGFGRNRKPDSIRAGRYTDRRSGQSTACAHFPAS